MKIFSSTATRTASAAFSIALVFFLGFGPLLPGNIRPAYAQLPVIETNPVIITSVTSSAVNSNIQTATTQVLNGIAWAVAKTAIQSLTRSMVNWINSGFNGSPAFVTDLDRNLNNLSDAVANNFFNALQRNTGVNVRSPFQDQVTQLLRNTYYGSTAKMPANSGYNLNRYSTNPQAYLNGNFAYGGFDAWFATLSNDQNNPLGAFHAQQNALESSIANVRTNQLHQLDWGRGFLSWRGDCIATASNPGGLALDANGEPQSTVPTSLSSADPCVGYEIKTPGSVIENALGITVTSPLRQLELADSINEIVGALASQMVTQVVGGLGLSGVSQPSAGGGASYLNQATNPSQYAQATTAGGFVANVASNLKDAQTYLAGWQKLQTLAQNCASTDPAVAAARTRATTNVTRGTTVSATLSKINAEATAAADSNSSPAAASSEYLALVQSGSLISSQDATDAQVQSAPATSGSTSLYSTLTALGCK